MNRFSRPRYTVPLLLLVGFVLSVAGGLSARQAPARQDSPQQQTPQPQAPNKALVVNGEVTGANVVQIDGRSYVDLEALAQATNGEVTFEPSQVLLTIPSPIGTVASVPEGLSRSFASAAIAALADMREWRGAVGTILVFGVPVVGTWPQDYRNRAEASLMQAAVAATTDADQNALGLLRNEFANLDQWAGNVVATRQSLNATNTVSPNVMQDDPLLTKITDCGRFLSGMIVSGSFADSTSCH